MKLSLINEMEKKEKEKLVLSPLKYTADEVKVFSQQTLDHHYDVHTKNYFKNADKDEFNKAGAMLHEIYWQQFKSFSQDNKPEDDSEILNFIYKNFDSFDSFKEQVVEKCMSVQGSGWVYLGKDCRLYTIKNHKIVDGVVLLLDCWEHAYYPSYLSDKQSFFKDCFEIIDWDVIQSRLD